MTEKRTATAILAGGCFWCLEAVFLAMKGVRCVQSGYIGGHEDAPSYQSVCSGDTGHAEAVKIEFDPEVVSFEDLLEVFFEIHDPTTPNRQGNDIGSQYRSAIFYLSPEQEAAARAMIEKLAWDGAFDAPIVTELEPATTFWPAEAYHDDYFARNPNQPYCRYVVGPKVAKFRHSFAARVKGN
ncbi:MAG: peptide-methionine (S)-S-oxide reductase MsrA [Zoogloea sp.]|jgi:peptide-methionine (S)-S-oxide reductase|uniref:peptide-methionine (S)-S-oxide reductase MsrA n=1 Tax=Zoogloea sp. TaxID=49181 RepID=UPI0026060D28|nr:peptide-methionine (S)-S-oxide reductase MsrA [Zoogloea sp.]MCK6386488.1 peptide-methionine (S)-S-oxide reductase MsrA [Zoogloea sp.]MDD3328931.1 peptide-methionine (S)-S-oxide reductase MsrA [Zoogloea sp.]